MDLFDKNMEVISQRDMPDYIAEMKNHEVSFTYIGTDEDGVKVFVDNNGKPFVIDQTVDNGYLPNVNLKQLIFFFGIASLREIKEVANSANDDSLFVIIEPNPYMLQHALYYEDFRILKDIKYIIVTEKHDNLTDLYKTLLSQKSLNLIRNVIFYLNSYYRKYDGGIIKDYITEIGAAIKNKYFSTGNSIHDSLIGLINNLRNTRYLSSNVDVAKLKNTFSDVPVFVVAAGPSLDKNINELKRIHNKGIIIAVDTIAQKLLDHGIIPDFITTVERGAIVWEYFYENKSYPNNMYLVSSLVADPRIVEKFNHKAVLPMRSDVREYYWLSEQLGLSQDHFVWMGGSCAHIAVGFAMHIGASPIVMVGQDLAYGENSTHASGTVYDEKGSGVADESITVEGYYGGQVRSNKIWVDFRLIFERKFSSAANLIINATEGGAKIEGTIQRPLSEVVDEFCVKECSVLDTMQTLPYYSIDWDGVEKEISNYNKELEESRKDIGNHLTKLRSYKKQWKSSMSDKMVKKIYETMKKTDIFYKSIAEDQLLYHNIQGPLLILMQKFYKIEENDSLSSLKENLDIQIELCEMIENTMWLISQVIEENFQWSGSEHSF